MQNLNVIKHEGDFSGFAEVGGRNRWKSLSGINKLGAGCASGALQSNSSRGCSLNLFFMQTVYLMQGIEGHVHLNAKGGKLR